MSTKMLLLLYLVTTNVHNILTDDVSVPLATRPPPDLHWVHIVGHLGFAQDLEFRIGHKVQWQHDTSAMNVTGDVDLLQCEGHENDNDTICLEWPDDRRLNITVETAGFENELQCYNIVWEALASRDQELTDCFDVRDSHWFGGYQDTNQYWPFERNALNQSDYLSHDGFWPGIGNVLERYFVSSTGIGIFVDNDVPLYFSLNIPRKGQMCFTAKYTGSLYLNPNDRLPMLKYTVCDGKNVKVTHIAMSEMFIPRPTGIPHKDVFKYPIWSTWAQYHYDINQSNIVEYALNIKYHNFTCSQVEIDDVWTPHYGDYDFDPAKFPNATEMIDYIKKLGCNVTVWVHPFFNNDSDAFIEAGEKGYLFQKYDSNETLLTSWWNGEVTGLLDVSNPDAVDWFLAKMERLKTEYHVDSFKFDAGEITWVPNTYRVKNIAENPCDIYPKQYVEMAARADPTNRQEVRSGYRSQEYPIFVRQMDKRSTWTGEGSFETVIPGALTLGLIGYPFVLPDMVGGNAYGTNYPDEELYIRWMQMNTFLPGLQLSIVPWEFNQTVIDVSRKYTEFHTQIADDIIDFAIKAVQTGNPIIRPLWWIDPEDERALTCGDEFLLGDRYLVAPIIKQNARSRDIFVPSGRWVDRLRGNGTHRVIDGPTVLTDYEVDLDELAYFENINYIW